MFSAPWDPRAGNTCFPNGNELLFTKLLDSVPFALWNKAFPVRVFHVQENMKANGSREITEMLPSKWTFNISQDQVNTIRGRTIQVN